MTENLPKKIGLRKEEITRDFLHLVEQHINDLVQSRSERRYHAADFAALLFIHPRHLTNTIKLTTGQSPCEIMEQRIVEETEKMLKQSSMSIADIGYKFAYNDPTNFTKFFKGMTGLTPLQFRKNIKLSSNSEEYTFFEVLFDATFYRVKINN